mmetsp:Transcript_25893/g.44044  ORF Transcript_25893/g.44044 Transcript_25893/m.44044 type:complete len:213 (-) Transcript_25893:164-802(-)
MGSTKDLVKCLRCSEYHGLECGGRSAARTGGRPARELHVLQGRAANQALVVLQGLFGINHQPGAGNVIVTRNRGCHAFCTAHKPRSIKRNVVATKDPGPNGPMVGNVTTHKQQILCVVQKQSPTIGPVHTQVLYPCLHRWSPHWWIRRESHGLTSVSHIVLEQTQICFSGTQSGILVIGFSPNRGVTLKEPTRIFTPCGNVSEAINKTHTKS